MPRKHEILVRVHAFTVNRTDCGILSGMPLLMRAFVGLTKPKKPTPGTDFAGVVERIGPEVKGWALGDRIMGFSDNGEVASQAEFTVIKEDLPITQIPDGISFKEAAASLEAAHYAYNFLNKLQVRQGEQVMVNGGTGAIGSAVIQFLKYEGLYVVATAPGSHLDEVRSLGPDRVINFEEEDFTALDQRFDYVFDAVGKSSYGSCLSILKPGGVYISSELGPGAENLWRPLSTRILNQPRVIFPIPTHIPKSIAYIKARLEDGSFKPLLDPRGFSMEQVPEAYRYAASGKKIGNIVIEP